ncbi:MAG: sensor histidine kinase [Nostocoides sp.]
MLPRPRLSDALLASAFVAWAVIEVAVGSLRGPVLVNLTSAVLATAVLAWRRSAPSTTALAVCGALALKTALGMPLDGLAMLSAALVAAYSVGRHRQPAPAAWTVLGMVLLGWVSLFGLSAADRTPSTYPFIAVWMIAPAAAGAALRVQVGRAESMAERATRAEMQREEHARLAVQSERGRIARELHDTVAHAVSVMVLHAGAVRSRLPEGLESERAALGQAEDTGRQAISELRRLLGVLRDDDGRSGTEPQPTLAGLDRLLDDTRRDGLTVTMRIEGDLHRLEPALEVSAYRIVQEALTNVRKHAGASLVSVRVAYEPEWLRLQVADDGIGASAPSPKGFGLVGIRERVAVFGGNLSLSTPAGGGFALEAALPLRQP